MTWFNWLTCALAATVLWGLEGFPIQRANTVHGSSMTAVIVGLAFAFACMAGTTFVGGWGDVARVTRGSFTNAALGGLASGVGMFFMVMALRLSPERTVVILVVTAMFPIVTALIGWLLGQGLERHQIAGVLIGLVGVVLVTLSRENWDIIVARISATIGN